MKITRNCLKIVHVNSMNINSAKSMHVSNLIKKVLLVAQNSKDNLVFIKMHAHYTTFKANLFSCPHSEQKYL